MDRYIEIEHSYENITLQFSPAARRPIPQPLSPENWKAFVEAEMAIYTGDPYAHGWTDVNGNTGDEMLNELWAQAENAVGASYEGNLPVPAAYLRAQSAKRVAQALAVISFGPEMLLK